MISKFGEWENNVSCRFLHVVTKALPRKQLWLLGLLFSSCWICFKNGIGMCLPSLQKHELPVQSASWGSRNLLWSYGTRCGTSIKQSMMPSGQAAFPGNAEPWMVWKSRWGEFFPESSLYAQERESACAEQEVTWKRGQRITARCIPPATPHGHCARWWIFQHLCSLFSF